MAFPVPNIRAITFPPPALPEGAAAAETFAQSNGYPDHGCSLLAGEVSTRTGILSFGNGSGEILAALAMISIKASDAAIMPAPTFPALGKGVQIAGGKLINVPLDAEHAAMLEVITSRSWLFYPCKPNNPTGAIFAAKDLARAAAEFQDDVLLVVDEAYYEFAHAECGPDVLAILSKRTGLWAVTRSFSKAYCLAGLRISYALVNCRTVQQALWQVRPNFNLSRPAIAAVAATMQDEAYLAKALSDVGRSGMALSLGLRVKKFPNLCLSERVI